MVINELTKEKLRLQHSAEDEQRLADESSSNESEADNLDAVDLQISDKSEGYV